MIKKQKVIKMRDCVWLCFQHLFFVKKKKAKDSLNDDAKNAINDLNKAILNIGEEELKDSNIKSGLIAGVLDCSNVFLNNSLWDGEIITHAYIGALVLK